MTPPGRLLAREGVRRVLGNTGWLIAERILRAAVAVTVTAAIARHLGPASFGVLSYAISFVLLFSTLWQLGLSGLVVRELVREPHRHNEIVGTVFVLRLGGAVIGFFAIVGAALLVGIDDETTRWAILIIAAGTIFYAFEGIDFWFQAEVISRYGVVARGVALLLASVLNVAFIVVDAPLLAFAAAASLEYVAIGVSLLVAYLVLGHRVSSWRLSGTQARAFLAMSWPLILSGIFASVNLRIDQLMLGNIAGPDAVGTYAAAARLSEVWYFVPVALATSVFPSLIRSRTADPATYRRRQQQLYDVMVALSLPLAVAVTLSSGLVVETLYGEPYAGASAVLAIHIWAGPFVFMAAILSKWLVAEDRLKFSFVRHGAGAAVNVGANLLLIPPLGPVGAAIATLVSYAVASFGACFVYGPTREAGTRMAIALLLPARLLLRALR